MEMRVFVLLCLLGGAGAASARVYRWIDEKGTVNYSNTAPPQGVRTTVIDSEAKAGPPSPESAGCYT
jgi:hypothetical protein